MKEGDEKGPKKRERGTEQGEREGIMGEKELRACRGKGGKIKGVCKK